MIIEYKTEGLIVNNIQIKGKSGLASVGQLIQKNRKRNERV